MGRFFVYVSQFMLCALAHADADICTIRPDLCDLPAKPRAPATVRCFPARADKRLNRNHLPICGAKLAPVAAVAPAPARIPASTATTQPLTFETYMQLNAHNPAMLRHGIEQQAFHDYSKPAVIIFPNIDGSTTEPASQTSSAGSSAAGLPGVPVPAAGGAPAIGGAPAGGGGSSDFTPGAGAK